MYQDHLLPLLRNDCASCHNPDKKKAGLDVSSYQALMAGSDGGPVVNPGDPDNSLFFQVVAHTKDPSMPKGKGKLQDKDIQIFKQWIADGAMENASGKPAVTKNKPKVNLAIAKGDGGKPTGPIAMPRDLLLEPVVHTQRPGALLCLAASPWAPLVAVGGQHQVLLYNTRTLELAGVLAFPEGEPYVARFSRSGAVLLVGGGIAAKSGHVVLFDVATGRRITQIGDEFDAVLAADISSDQSTVALGGPGKVVKTFSTADGQPLYVIKKHTDWVTALSFSPDGVLLASGDRQGGLWVWETKTGNEFYNLSGHKAAITSVCFRGDSNILASASEDGTVKLWEMQSGKEIKSWGAHGDGALSVHFTHDGRLVTCGRDKVVREWKPDGNGLLTTEPFPDIALHAAFDDDGKRIVAGDWSGALRVFDAQSGKPVGELSADPPSIAERLADANKRLPDVQAAYDKASGELADAQKAAEQSSAELQSARTAVADATNTIEQMQAMEKLKAEAAQAAETALKGAEGMVAAKQKDVDRLAESAKRMSETRDAAARQHEALIQTASAKQKTLDEARQAADKAKTESQKAPEDKKLASAAEDAKASAEKAAAELADAQKAVGANTDQLSTLTTATKTAEVEAGAAQRALSAARDALSARQSDLQKANDQRRAAVEVVAISRKDMAEKQKQIAPRTEQAKAAAERLAKLRPPADQAERQLVEVKSQVLKLKAAQFNVGVWAAKDELAAKQAQFDQLNSALQDAKAGAEKISADISTAEKILADAPQRIKAREGAIAQAKQAVTAAASAADGAKAVLTEREALLKQASDLAGSLSTAATKSSEDKALAEAAAKAKASMDLLGGDVDAFRKLVSASAETRKQSQAVLASSEAALAREKADIETAPKRIASLQQGRDALAAELKKDTAALDDLRKALDTAQAHVTELTAQYQRLNEATASSPLPLTIPKS